MSRIYNLNFIKSNGRYDSLEIVVKNSESPNCEKDIVYLMNYILNNVKRFDIVEVTECFPEED